MSTPLKKRTKRKTEQADFTPSTQGGDFDDLLELADLSDVSEVLLKFDMDYRFGPCRGLTRQERFARAVSLKIDGVDEYSHVMKAVGNDSNQSVFDRRLKGGL